MPIGTPTRIASYASTVGETTGSSKTITFDGGAAVGDLVIIDVVLTSTNSAQAAFSTISGSAGNTWKVDQDFIRLGSTIQNGVSSSIITTPITAGQSLTVTVTGTSEARWVITAHKVSGIDGTVSRVDVTPATATGTGLTTLVVPATGGMTTATPEVLLWASFAKGTQTFTAGTNWTAVQPQVSTSVGASERGIAQAYRIVSATGTYAADITLSASSSYSATLIAYKAAAAPAATHAFTNVVLSGGATVFGGAANATVALSDGDAATGVTFPSGSRADLTLRRIEKPAGDFFFTINGARFDSASASVVATLRTAAGTQIAGTGSVTVNPGTSAGDLTITFPAASIDTEVTEAQWRAGDLVARLDVTAA